MQKLREQAARLLGVVVGAAFERAPDTNASVRSGRGGSNECSGGCSDCSACSAGSCSGCGGVCGDASPRSMER